MSYAAIPRLVLNVYMLNCRLAFSPEFIRLIVRSISAFPGAVCPQGPEPVLHDTGVSEELTLSNEMSFPCQIDGPAWMIAAVELLHGIVVIVLSSRDVGIKAITDKYICYQKNMGWVDVPPTHFIHA